jgi:hypothetical protein
MEPRAIGSKNGKRICRIIPDKDAEMNFAKLRGRIVSKEQERNLLQYPSLTRTLRV